MLCFPLFNIKNPLSITTRLSSLEHRSNTGFPFVHLSSQSFPLPSSREKPENVPRFSWSFKSEGNPASFSSSSSSIFSISDDFEDELDRLLALLPEELRRKVSGHSELGQLMEVVMDLGRKPLARFPSGDFLLSDNLITVQEIEYAASQVGDFAIDNRAGISRTLHRISAIRNRKGEIVGLTCRVGRAITGSANLLRDLVLNGASLLLIGPPGVGKTTIIREVARMLANDYKKRVMIVDTSNEIGGDGDIPHPGIGNARRMQVPDADKQHKVLIEAVENHMPQVIVIDEIGTKLEAMAASTIAQRGIQLVATAHGVTIENLIMNPSLEILVGGVQSVTLGDEEANRRGVQKTVQERKGPPTFSCGVEIISKTELRVHRSLEATVDAILSGRSPNVEVRNINSQAVQETEKDPSIEFCHNQKDEMYMEDVSRMANEKTGDSKFPPTVEMGSMENAMPFYLYLYGITETIVIQAVKELEIDDKVEITDNFSEADGLLALHSKLKKNPRFHAAAKANNIPIYLTKTSSLIQVTKAISALLADHTDGLNDSISEDGIRRSEKMDSLEEARIAIEQVVIPNGEAVDLLPRPPRILSLQSDLVRKYRLESERVSKGADFCIRILPFRAKLDDEVVGASESKVLDEFLSFSGGSGHGEQDVLPILPE